MKTSITLLVFLPIILLNACYSPTKNKLVPLATNGVLDLRNWDFSKDGIVKLNGEWEFYWNQLLIQQDFNNENIPEKSGNISVPGNWKAYDVDGKEISHTGFATYRLIILTDTTQKHLKINYSLPVLATTCYVNEKKVLHSGRVGKNKEDFSPVFIVESESFYSKDKQFEIIIQVANFYDPKGGIFSEVSLGNKDQINNLLKKANITDSFLLGSFLLMVIYHIILFFLRTKEKTPLFFALSSLGFFLNYLIMHGVLSVFFPDVSFIIHFRILFFSLALAVGALFLFVYSLFPEDFKKKAIYIITGLNLLFPVISILPESILFSKFIVVFSQLLLFSSSVYTIIVIFKAYLRKRRDAGTFLIALLVIILSMVNDTLHNLNIINTTILVNFGLLTFFLFQSYIISARFSRAFGLSEKLTADLQYMNENLEGMVTERTHEIEQQKEEILTQTEQLKSQNDQLLDLDRFKQGLTSMIVHDLKNPLNTILSVSNSEGGVPNRSELGLIKNTGRQMLNMVLNILDVNKFEEANISLELKTYSVRTISVLAAEQVGFLIKQKNIQLLNKISPEYLVLCDREITERLFVNLLTNAIKYSPHNSIVELMSYRLNNEQIPAEFESINLSKNEDSRLLIAVRDYGPGIQADALPKIFQKFRQIEAVESGGIKSTGLGLTFCKLAVEAHGGQIGVISRLKQGSTFWFTMNVSDLTEAEKTKQTGLLDEKLELNFTEDEKNRLKQYITHLKELEYYEVTNIKKILTNTSPENSNSIQAWKEQVELAVINCNQEEYEKLIKSV